MFYLARTLTRQLVQGDSYDRLRRAVGVHLLDFTLFGDSQARAQAVWRFQLRDQWQPLRMLGEELELNLVELPKALGLIDPPKALSAWVKFFERWNEEMTMADIDDPAVRDAYNKLETLSADLEAQLRAEAREKWIHDQVSWREWALRTGREEGREEGRSIGRLEGEALMLQRMLTHRFGPLPDDLLARLQSASAASLERWSDQLLEAPTLEQVFAQD